MRRRGFTLVELIIGMVITAMVLCALSVVTFAVSNGWENAQAADSSFVTGGQVQARIAQWFRPATAVGAAQRGSLGSTNSPAALFFWKSDVADVSNPTGDDKIEFNEIGLLRYDAASRQVRVYDASDWASWSAAAQSTANALAGTAYISSTLTMSDFLAACPNYHVVMRDVSGMVINTVTTGDKPLVEYVITMTDSRGASSTHYGTVTLRAAQSASN